MVFGLFVIGLILIVGVFLSIWRQYKDTELIRTVTSTARGETSERDVILKLIKMGINPRAIFHDCYIRKSSGTYTQIDLVVAVSQGLLVFEIKDYSGWLFGNYRQKYWTQILAYGKEKHRFFNPIMQNNIHINAIRENLHRNPDIPIFSIIVFYGNCELKDVTTASDNEYLIYPYELEETIGDIISRPLAEFGDKHEIMNLLTLAVANGENPDIISSQLNTASIASRNRPQSTYHYSSLFSIFRRWSS